MKQFIEGQGRGRELDFSVNYLEFMIFLSSSDYPSQFRKLVNSEEANFKLEENIFKNLRTFLVVNQSKSMALFEESTELDGNIFISQINSSHKTYKFLRFVLTYCRSFNIVEHTEKCLRNSGGSILSPTLN